MAAGSFTGEAYALRSFIAVKMSAITSAFGLAPKFPLPWVRTETFPASMLRAPMTNRVWTFAVSASGAWPFV